MANFGSKSFKKNGLPTQQNTTIPQNKSRERDLKMDPSLVFGATFQIKG